MLDGYFWSGMSDLDHCEHLTFKLLVWCKKRMHHFGWNAILTVYSIFNIMHQYEVPLLFWSPRCWSFASFEQRFADRSDLCKPLEVLTQVIGSGLGRGVAGWSVCFLIKDVSFILFLNNFRLRNVPTFCKLSLHVLITFTCCTGPLLRATKGKERYVCIFSVWLDVEWEATWF